MKAGLSLFHGTMSRPQSMLIYDKRAKSILKQKILAAFSSTLISGKLVQSSISIHSSGCDSPRPGRTTGREGHAGPCSTQSPFFSFPLWLLTDCSLQTSFVLLGQPAEASNWKVSSQGVTVRLCPASLKETAPGDRVLCKWERTLVLTWQISPGLGNSSWDTSEAWGKVYWP